MENPKLNLKLIINPKANRVLFAETDKDFVDFLRSLFSLPLGIAINLLKDAPPFSSIQTLYKSVQNLKDCYMQQPNHKYKDLSDADPQQVTSCKNTRCTKCGHVMDNPATVKGDIKYMVMDDLSVSPIISIESCFDILRKLNASDVAALQTRVVEVDAIEVVELLKASLESKEVLTNVFLLSSKMKHKNPRLTGTELEPTIKRFNICSLRHRYVTDQIFTRCPPCFSCNMDNEVKFIGCLT
ncbi:uncharacterized protein LOC126661215 [Mercurialis annua]|uniref:uncharacterized protein LOC126661215 n=1 Tax=Mercurialis annua TaxID=3986 RepID=UPI0021601874|nr:uncharacterized protein LOC126661215 [Mercurialis annua]